MGPSLVGIASARTVRTAEEEEDEDEDEEDVDVAAAVVISAKESRLI